MKSIWRTLIPAAIATLIFACSDDSDNTAGGATEATNGIATIDTVVVTDTISRVDTISLVDTVSRIDTIAVIDTVLPENPYVISDKEIAGVIQKGPFVKGAPVTVLELDGTTLHQTGRAFRGKVGEKGTFSVKNLNLTSNFAILEANGYYWNELTGQMSTSPITLNAIADLSDRENVNINLLTQLEYERVQLLIEKKKLSVAEAKKQAREEILKAFNGNEENGNLEDMDIFGTDNGDALLLAASIMIMGDRTEAELTELLYNIATDMEGNGLFDNDSIRIEIADRAAFNLNIPQIRKNILSWEMTDSLPNFEKYIEKFWVKEYKLGTCNNDSTGVVKQNGNKLSSYASTQFICQDGSWTPIFYNTKIKYGSATDSRDGQVYRTTKIGNQVWIAENMKYRPTGADYIHNCYDDNEMNCERYGVLYGLVAALEACPAGFHLPSEAEWRTLADFLGGDSIAAPKLRAIGGWNVKDHPSTKNDKDEYGFSALPAGVYYFGALGVTTYYWTSNTVRNEDGSYKGAYNIAVGPGKKMEFGGAALASTRTSVRCIQDSDSTTP